MMKTIPKKLLDWFDNKSLGFRFLVVFGLAITLPLLFLAYASYRMTQASLIEDVRDRLNTGIMVASMEYHIRGDQMRMGMLQAASEENIKRALIWKNGAYIKGLLKAWKDKRRYVDIWMVVNKDKKVISRFNSDIVGDEVEINGLVEKALTSGTSQESTEILPEDLMDREGELHGYVTPPVLPPMDSRDWPGVEGDEMAFVVVTPVLNSRRRPIGAIITADVLNRDLYVPESVAQKLPGFFVTIAMRNIRIATTVKGGYGQPALWTTLPAEMVSTVGFKKGVLREWEFFGLDYVSLIEPLRDNKGRYIGSIDVAVPKSRLWSIQRTNQGLIAFVTFLAIIASLILAHITSRKIVTPLKKMKNKADAFLKGNMDVRMEVDEDTDTKDELKVVSRAFNSMVGHVRAAEMERGRYLGELEDKNVELLDLNKKLKEMNEKIEISTEEIYAQTEELIVSNEELQEKNRELSSANETIRKEEEEKRFLIQRVMQAEKLTAIGEMVSGVAHELNNPLTTIMGFSDILLAEDLPDKVKKRLKMINNASHISKRTIGNLLAFARVQKPEKGYHDLNAVIRDIVALKEHHLKGNNIDLELRFAQLPMTVFDQHQIQQVVLNLLNNAEHAVCQKDKGRRITISTDHSGGILKLTVSDTGAGMTKDVLNRIFDPFFTTKEVGKGTGLGLSISYGIIKEHGGNIYAESIEGAGTDVRVELPVLEAEECSLPAPDSPMEQLMVSEPARSKRILIIDDEPDILELLNEVLSDLGFCIDRAAGGSEALVMLQDTAYDLIISDIKMPHINGRQFYRLVLKKWPGIAERMIFISGDTVNRETQDFLNETGMTFLEKPFTPMMLGKIVLEQMERLEGTSGKEDVALSLLR